MAISNMEKEKKEKKELMTDNFFRLVLMYIDDNFPKLTTNLGNSQNSKQGKCLNNYT